MKIYNIKEKQEYLKEVAILEHLEWGSRDKNEEEFEFKIKRNIDKIVNNFENPYFCKLILLDNEKLVGFISMFESDGEEYKNLKPWYATMYVKDEYRGHGYSKILNDAILKEAYKRGYDKLYLKSYLNKLKNGESLFYINTKIV